MAINRRLILWLVRAYIQKWGKAIFIFFILGLIIFFLLQTFVISFITKITSENKQTIGVVGTYTTDSLPSPILQQVSRGLTSVSPDGNVRPGLASSWQIKDGGKTYIFILRPDKHFFDGTLLTSQKINMSFANVTINKPNDKTIVFKLKDSYAPFLTTMSRPIFIGNFIGFGPYKIKSINTNSNFVDSISLVNINNPGITKIYQFYPTEGALKLAFALGEVSKAENLTNTEFNKKDFSFFPNSTISKTTDYTTLVTLFYNTTDKYLSDPKLREAFSYTIPNSLDQGERAYSPISPLSWAYENNNPHTQDFTHAKLLLDASFGNSGKYPSLTISALSKYSQIAKIIQESWKKIGIDSKIVIVNNIPSAFQVYLGDFHVPADPDQYTLWHSYQENNIANFNKDLRVDKLLEDGRKTVDQSQRIKIYADFQKYLINDQPATFLYFPYSYTITRK